MRSAWWILAVAACTAPDKLVVPCGDGVVEAGEDCDPAATNPASTVCASAGEPHQCQYVCDPTVTTLQCPAGSACGGDGVCVAEPGTCGNGVVDPGEDCELGVTLGPGTCGAAGAQDACHFVCGATVACPVGAACGPDGRCRDAGGSFAEAAGSPFAAPRGAFTVRDFDGDGRLDIVSTTDGLVVELGAGASTFAPPTFLDVPTRDATVGDVDGDGRQDLVFGASNGRGFAFHYELGQPASRFAEVAFPFADLASLGDDLVGAPDVWIAMRPDAAAPEQALLHVEFEGSTLRLGFDEDGDLFADPAPVTIQGSAGSLSSWPTLGGAAYPVADALAEPATGGDELALGLPGDDVIRIFTAGDGGLGVSSLIADAIIALPASLVEPPLFADIDGDGHLDVVATVAGSGSGSEVVVAFGTGTSFGAPQLDGGLTGASCFPTATANVAPGAPAELFCDGGVFARNGDGTVSQVSPPTSDLLVEGVFVDLNRDGVPDLVAATARGLEVELGDASGLFARTLVPTAAPPENLRVGDFDGDQVSDVGFVDVEDGVVTLRVLYGSTGALAAPVTVGSRHAPSSVEPVLFEAEQGFGVTATTGLVVDDDAASTGVAQLTLLVGDSDRTMDDPIGFDRFSRGTISDLAPVVLAGRYSGSASADQIVELVQDPANQIAELDVAELPTNSAHRPTNELPALVRVIAVTAFRDTNVFDVMDCASSSLFATGDVDGDQVDDVVALQAFAAGSDGACIASTTPKLLTLSTTTGSAGDTNQPIALTTSGRDARTVQLADLDGDGHLDLLIAFDGDAANTGNVFLVVWGGATGLTTSTTEVPVIPGTSAQADAVALHLDASASPELLVTTSVGLFAYDLQSDRSYRARSTPVIDYTSPTSTIAGGSGTTLAVGDLNGDGLADLLVDDRGAMHVLLMVPAASTAP